MYSFLLGNYLIGKLWIIWLNLNPFERRKASDPKVFLLFYQIPTAHSQQEDPNKPYWILRVVTEHNEAEYLEVKKDTERADEIRAMKQAWEMAEPGRAIKVS